LPRVPQRDPEYFGALLRFSAGELFLPATKAQRYPVLYILHGLGGNEQEMALSGEWTLLRDLRRDHKAGDFLVVASDGWDTFYINSRDGKTLYGNFFLREFVPFIERMYRIRAERAARGITGFSMGGYGALRIGFAHPELFGSVSAHSAALMRDPPQGVKRRGVSREFGGQDSDQCFRKSDRPEILGPEQSLPVGEEKLRNARKNENLFRLRHRGLLRLQPRRKRNGPGAHSLKIPHEFHLYPGGHSVSFSSPTGEPRTNSTGACSTRRTTLRLST